MLSIVTVCGGLLFVFVFSMFGLCVSFVWFIEGVGGCGVVGRICGCGA